MTGDQLQLLLGPMGLLVAALMTAYVLWRAHTAADKALIDAATLRGNEWKSQAEAKGAEVARLTDSLDKLTTVVEASVGRPPARARR